MGVTSQRQGKAGRRGRHRGPNQLLPAAREDERARQRVRDLRAAAGPGTAVRFVLTWIVIPWVSTTSEIDSSS
jgi:hypothetical protein